MTGKKERQRKLARERVLRQQQRRAAQARRTRQITMISVVCLVVVGLGVGGFFLFSQPGTTSNAAASAPVKTCSLPTNGRHPGPQRRQAARQTGLAGRLPGHHPHQPR